MTAYHRAPAFIDANSNPTYAPSAPPSTPAPLRRTIAIEDFTALDNHALPEAALATEEFAAIYKALKEGGGSPRPLR